MKRQNDAMYIILTNGNEMRTYLLEKGEPARIKKFSFQLVYQLRKQNMAGYMEAVMKQYLKLDKQVPHKFLQTFHDDTLFLAAGYAYLAGLNGAIAKEEDA